MPSSKRKNGRGAAWSSGHAWWFLWANSAFVVSKAYIETMCAWERCSLPPSSPFVGYLDVNLGICVQVMGSSLFNQGYFSLTQFEIFVLVHADGRTFYTCS